MGEIMENKERPRGGRRKLTFSLRVKDGEINGSGEGKVSPVQTMGSFLEKVELELVLPQVELSIWEILEIMGICCFSMLPKSIPE